MNFVKFRSSCRVLHPYMLFDIITKCHFTSAALQYHGKKKKVTKPLLSVHPSVSRSVSVCWFHHFVTGVNNTCLCGCATNTATVACFSHVLKTDIIALLAEW